MVGLPNGKSGVQNSGCERRTACLHEALHWTSPTPGAVHWASPWGKPQHWYLAEVCFQYGSLLTVWKRSGASGDIMIRSHQPGHLVGLGCALGQPMRRASALVPSWGLFSVWLTYCVKEIWSIMWHHDAITPAWTSCRHVRRTVFSIFAEWITTHANRQIAETFHEKRH